MKKKEFIQFCENFMNTSFIYDKNTFRNELENIYNKKKITL